MARALLASFADNFKLTDPDAPLTPRQWRIEILSGLTVALALVPEAVAFAFVAGVEPLVGLYAAFIVGLITAVFGGRPGMISGATGALAVVMVSLVAMHGVEYLFATVVLMGLIQIFVGVMRWGKFIQLVPHLLEVLPLFSENQRRSLFLALHRIWDMYFPIGEEFNLEISPHLLSLITRTSTIIKSTH